MRFLVFDPGHTTGWALFEDDHVISAGESPDWKDIPEMINQAKVDLVLFESFKLYPWKAKQKIWDSFLEVEVIGVIKAHCYFNNILFYSQQPSDKEFFDNDKLRDLGVFKVSTSRHARDAIRHGYVFLTFGEGKGEHSADIIRRVQKD